ncbi:bifunctional 4-hydroxy-2-oxoglutarate aldolase/2-dehydro-3-deoxy-phosphogluconate aldolase [Aquisalimonas asiatica]|uniref:2-dehydro-3-deoxy-phosphogluconate aldolase n=1 Tax=Aquisalimonas asiatica TaxID=406100 RepID=A0A1H8RJK8_9GAMM|nr:bifunctional 4-hydroxy-2-oxoglutarate aldolase/2-dehydro-3-deoxy-phosphogluconate aldolase [Aquisalimonas asiatica]SEO66374.1 2-dehydro-3-deoxyphosphogluconate aldolase / (4S)-4-hydroxy-2-oxoglutarate aldolase [Aquisalimonas asiatica]
MALDGEPARAARERGTMDMQSIMTAAPVIPVLRIDDPVHAAPLARALVDGGLPVLEITLRTPCAMDAVAAMIREVPDAIVGVGTILQPEDMRRAADAGAAFAVSPGLTPALVEAARDSGLPFLPGVMTPGEAMQAREYGFRALKLFPAEQAGGVPMLKALAGPLPDLTFCPTGGVTQVSFTDYLALPNVACVGGSWLAPADSVAAGDWEGIKALAAAAAASAHI